MTYSEKDDYNISVILTTERLTSVPERGILEELQKAISQKNEKNVFSNYAVGLICFHCH